jgi:hypothetical protein
MSQYTSAVTALLASGQQLHNRLGLAGELPPAARARAACPARRLMRPVSGVEALLAEPEAADAVKKRRVELAKPLDKLRKHSQRKIASRAAAAAKELDKAGEATKEASEQDEEAEEAPIAKKGRKKR